MERIDATVVRMGERFRVAASDVAATRKKLRSQNDRDVSKAALKAKCNKLVTRNLNVTHLAACSL